MAGGRDGSTKQKKRRNGVTIVYSRQGEKADSVIVRIARTKASGCVVISSDREILNPVEKFGAVAISSGEFARVLRTIRQPFENLYEQLDASADKE
jgi:predicted RNA-binding protein with PIN domain